eukprot:13529893-Alexandrium_andersonii.AAC.1
MWLLAATCARRLGMSRCEMRCLAISIPLPHPGNKLFSADVFGFDTRQKKTGQEGSSNVTSHVTCPTAVQECAGAALASSPAARNAATAGPWSKAAAPSK